MKKAISIYKLSSSVMKFIAFVLLFLLIGVDNINAATRIASSSGNWSSTATWGGSAVPTSADDVTINNGISVTINVTAVCNSITTVNTGIITISGNNVLTVNGLIAMARPSGNNTNFTIAVGSGSLIAGSLTMNATTTTRNNVITISTGTLTVTGTFTSVGTTGCQLTLTGAGVIDFQGTTTLTGNPSLTTFAGSEVIYSRSGVQNGIVGTYQKLTLSGTNPKTFASTPTVNDTLSMEGTATIAVTAGVVTYGPNATLQYNTSIGRTVTSEEWLTTFAATGGVVINNTGLISLNEDKIFNIGVSIGLVVINQGFGNVSEIIHAADSACYSAKSAGRNQSFLFNAGDVEVVKHKSAMESISDITDEIDDEQFMLYCQPIVPLIPQNPHHRHYEILLRKRW